MSNMSYCRFENTVRDMWDCIDELEKQDWNMCSLIYGSDASEQEQKGMKDFVGLCKRVVREIGDYKTD